MGYCLLLVLILVGVILLPGLWAGRIVARRCGLGAMAVLVLGVIFSLAFVPLVVYDVSLLIPLKGTFGFFWVSLGVAVVGVGMLCCRVNVSSADMPNERPPVRAGDHRLKGVLAVLLLYVGVITVVPFLRDGEVHDGMVLWNWIDDVQYDQGILNGILQFGLPGRNNFIETGMPLGYHHFAMIFKAVPVFLSGHRLDPYGVSIAVNTLTALLFVGLVALLLRRRFSWSATLFAIVAMIFLSAYDAIPYILGLAKRDAIFALSGRVCADGLQYGYEGLSTTDVMRFLRDPLGHPSTFMPDNWAPMEKLRVLTPYAYMIWQARHLAAVCFFLVILVLVWRRERAPVAFGALAGLLMASMVGYSIPVAVNAVIVLAVLFVWIFACDIPRRRAAPALMFCGAGAAAGVAGLPFVWNFFRDGQDAGMFLRFPEKGVLYGVALIDYGPLLLFAAAGLWMIWRRREWKALDGIVMISTVVTGIVLLTVRRTLGSIIHHNDLGVTACIVMTAGLAYAAAWFREYADPAWRDACVFTRPRMRLMVEFGLVLFLSVLCAVLRLSSLYAIAGIVMVAGLEGLIRLGVWPVFRLWPCWLVVLFVGVVTHVYDVKGHTTAETPFSVDGYRALLWAREHTEPDAIVQPLPSLWTVQPVRGIFIPAIAFRRLYVGVDSYVFASEALLSEHQRQFRPAWTEATAEKRWHTLDRLGIDYVMIRRSLADRYADPALFEVVYDSSDCVVVRVKRSDRRSSSCSMP